MTTIKRFRVALSFPGERRSFVASVAAELRTRLGEGRVLYDKFLEAEFARANLSTYLQGLYHDQSDLIAVFLDVGYESKPWCGLEWRALLDLIHRGSGHAVMLLSFDETLVSGLFLSVDGYLSIGARTPGEIVALILERLTLAAPAPAQAEVVRDPPRVVPRQPIEDLRCTIEAHPAQDAPSPASAGPEAVRRQDVKIGILTALPHECAAMRLMLSDEIDDTAPGEGGGRTYYLGRIPAKGGGVHVVAVALLPDMGNNSAAISATRLLQHFPNARHVIMCGIAGGVPRPGEAEHDVRLGDIVVCDRGGVVQYDLVKERPDGTKEHRHPPRPPSAYLLEAVRHLRVDEELGRRPWEAFLGLGGAMRSRFERPEDHLDARGEAVFYPPDPQREPGKPRVFHGTIAAANTLLKNPAHRDYLGRTFGAKAVEMEGSGLADAAWVGEVGYLVVRGICDHCDERKGDVWQRPAAIAAAAYVRALLGSLPGGARSAVDEPGSQAPAASHEDQVNGEPSAAVGIDNRGANITQMIIVHGNPTFGPTTINAPTTSDREPTIAAVDVPHEPLPKVAPTRLPHNATKLFGRETELERLDADWASSGAGKVNVVAIIAWGGVGKTSLVFEWMNRLGAAGWRGATKVFDWSFYSQGVRERGTASGDAFVREALRFFGDDAMADSAASAWDKGARLAALVGQQRAVLVLDGLEPLQQPPGRGVAAGKLSDPAIAALLRGLARTNAGLCVVTTREPVEDLEGFGPQVSERSLERLSEDAGVALLEHLLGDGRFAGRAVQSTTAELRAIVGAVDGHALTLNLLGRYLRRRQWDVRRWKEIRFTEADRKVQGGHAFRMLEAYERWLGDDDGDAGLEGRRMLAVLRVLGLFDRPADPGCMGALCGGEAIDGLTEALVGLDEGEWSEVLTDLEGLGLVSRVAWEPARLEGFPKARTELDTGKTTGAPEVRTMPGWSRLSDELDAHPLVREHFGRRVRETSEAAWREGHRRVFEHLCESTPYWPEGEEGLRPLYQAVAHGCQAGEVEKARAEVYRDRIQRGTSDGGFYSTKKLGALGAELGALAWLFESPWSRPSPSLTEGDQAWLLNEAAFDLRALGRLAEAVEPMRAGLEKGIEQENWKSAAIRANNLGVLELPRGEVEEALRVAEQSVTFADRSTDAFQRMVNRTTHADALHQAGRRQQARRRFEEAEVMQAERQPKYPRLYSLQGFQFCDLLLSEAERAAWRVTMAGSTGSATPRVTTTPAEAVGACDDVLGRATQTLEWSMSVPNASLLCIALNHLTLGRASLYRALLVISRPAPVSAAASSPASPDLDPNFATAKQHLHAAVEGLRRAGITDYLPRGLLSHAWLHHLLANRTAAATDLDEAKSIATRCGMPIFLADVHLTRARLFRDRTALAKARELLADLAAKGYHCHDEMLADAEAAAEIWPETSQS